LALKRVLVAMMRAVGLWQRWMWCRGPWNEGENDGASVRETMRDGGTMSGMKQGTTLVILLLAMLAGWTEQVSAKAVLAQAAAGTVATTTVQDTVYRADGTPASGTVLISWSAFTTAAGNSVAAGTTSVTLGPGGALTVSLAPNAGSTPIGTYYTAVFHLDDGTTTSEYWVLPVTPVGGSPAKLAAIQNQVLPTSVAMQTVSKAYVDTAIARAQAGLPSVSSTYVLKTGDTMSGPLVLPGDPVSPNQAADKNYVDGSIAAVSGGVGGAVRTLPAGTQDVSQPTGTQLSVNLLNGDVYASQYAAGLGNNAIANALASPDCASGCQMKIEPTYTGTDLVQTQNMTTGVTTTDERGGSLNKVAMNPLAAGGTYSTTESLTQIETLSVPQLEAIRPGASSLGVSAMTIGVQAPTGGSNLYPETVETPPYFKSTYGALSLSGSYNTQGQHVQLNNTVSCFSVGDCLAGGQFVTSMGGYRDNGDEGTHPWDLQVGEDVRVFQGTCTTGCTTGSTSIYVSATASAGTQGDGRFLIDKNPAKVISNGTLVTGTKTVFGAAGFSGVNFPVSVFVETAQAATSQPTNMAPGTVTLPIQTTGLPATWYSASTAGLASTGVACVADPDGSSTGRSPNFEMANYSVVDATHLKLTLNKVHVSGATVAVGGLCGYGLEQTVDTEIGIRQVFPVVGSISSTGVYYADGGTQILGTFGNGSTGGYVHLSQTITSISRASGVVTVTMSTAPLEDMNDLNITISGVADASYNGTFVVTTTGPTTFTYADAGADGTSSGGTASIVTGGFAMYPMAEVLSVANPANKIVDGTFTLGPNTVAWAAGDPLEEPHFYVNLVTSDVEFITQYMPRPVQYAQAGKVYFGNVGPGMHGWEVVNGAPLNSYLGAGGTHGLPDAAYQVSGPWSNDMEMDAAAGSVMYLHCNLHGCNHWNSGYNLFYMDAATGWDYLNYQPQNSTVQWDLGGVPYTFSPGAFSAGTINVGTLNASTIHGSVPVFGASGAGHAAGSVPDPGATAGTSRYLREDGTWSAPAGTGGSGGAPSGTAGGDLGGSYPSPTVSSAQNGAIQFLVPSAGLAGTSFQAGSSDKGFLATYSNGTVDLLTLAINRNPSNGAYTDPSKPNASINMQSLAGGSSLYVITNSNNGTDAGQKVFNFDQNGNFSVPGMYQETLTTPASSSAACTTGQFTDDANFHYVCVATNTWKRVALSSF
jgi:hypothetical protein